MSGPYDAIVVGAGHNGLVCAAYLARAGWRVVVLEAADTLGGCAGTVDALGARVNVCNCDHTMVRATPIAAELDLAAHGLRYLDVDPTGVAVNWGGGPPWIAFRDAGRTVDALRVTHPDQVDGYRRYLEVALPAARLLLELTGSTPDPVTVLRRLAGRRGSGLRTLLSWSRQPVGTVLAAFFTDPTLAGAMMTTGPAVWGLPPETPGTGLGALGPAVRHLVGVGRPVGGSGAYPAAVAGALLAAGGETRTGARVCQLVCEGAAVRGVALDSGEIVEAPVVVSSVDPRRTLVGWLSRPPAAARRMAARWAARPTPDGYESKVDAVVSAPPRPRALRPGLLDRLGLDLADALAATTVVSGSLADLSAAHHLLSAGRVATWPMFLANAPSVRDPSMAVADGHVFSLETLWTPYALAGGWARTSEPERWLAAYAELVQPGFLDGVLRWRAVTPPDYERDLGLERGHAPSFAGGPLAALLGRDRELTRYATPVRGLYLTGAGTFPGAGVWGASGRNAAHAVLASAG